MKKNIRLVYDNIENDCIIPNAMPETLTKKMIEHVRLHGSDVGFREQITSIDGITYPYASNWDLGFTTADVDILSELDFNDLYLTSEAVNYLYLVGTAGNFDYGINPIKFHSSGSLVKTSYFENLSEQVINYLQTKLNFFIFFRNQQEGLSFSALENVYLEALKYKIPLEKIIIQTDSANYDDLKKEVEKKYNINLNIKYFLYPWSLPLAAEYFEELKHINNLVNDFKTNRKHKCICLNKRLKDYRISTISYLLGMGYDDIYLSYNKKFGMNNYLIETCPNQELKNILEKGYEIFNTTEIRKADDIDDDFDKVYWDDSKMYEDSYFSIVTESTFYGGLRVTEKITKPILNYHPFIVVGPRKTLELLKFYGFKTFSDFWDESYDEIVGVHDRFIAITKVINYLMNLTTEEWDVLTKKLKPILIHNRETLIKYSNSNISSEFLQNLNLLLENQFTNKYYSILCSES